MSDTNKHFDTAKGFIISNIFAFIVIGIESSIKSNFVNRLIFSEFIIVPILMGIISAWYWKDLELRSRLSAQYSFLNSLLAVFLSSVFLGEGFICLLIGSPLIFGFMCLGTYIGRKMFKKNNNELNMSIIVLLLFLFIADSASEHNYENEVTDKITINASPDKIWKNVVAFEPIRQKPNYWLFRIGMPSPIATTVTGYYKGAGRKCIFSNGYVFGEKIVTYYRDKDFTFDIIDQPRDPEIMNHIDILRGQFLLHDNGNGTTTLTGNSWYKLYVFPTWYYDIWAQSITRNVHLRVMQHIKQLSEKD
jgi:hypothetical protein